MPFSPEKRLVEPLADRSCLVGRLRSLPYGQLTANGWLIKVCFLPNCTLWYSLRSRAPCGIRLKSPPAETTSLLSSLSYSILLPSSSFSWDDSHSKSNACDSLSQEPTSRDTGLVHGRYSFEKCWVSDWSNSSFIYSFAYSFVYSFNKPMLSSCCRFTAQAFMKQSKDVIFAFYRLQWIQVTKLGWNRMGVKAQTQKHTDLRWKLVYC